MPIRGLFRWWRVLDIANRRNNAGTGGVGIKSDSLHRKNLQTFWSTTLKKSFSLVPLQLLVLTALVGANAVHAAPAFEFHAPLKHLTVAPPPPPAGGQLSLSTASLAFVDTTVGQTSPGRSFQVLNSGAGALTLGGAAVLSGPFEASSNCGSTLASGSACDVTVVFKPTATGDAQGSLQVTSSVGNQQVALTGKGVMAALGTSPGSLNLGDVHLGQSSTPQYITLSNVGTQAVTVNSVVADNPFYVHSNGCPSTLAPQSNCQIGVRMTPAAVGQYSSALHVTTSLGLQNIPLSGVGVAATVSYQDANSLTLTALNFPATDVGTESPAQTVYIKNTGTGDLKFNAPGVTVPTPFQLVTNNCSGATVAPNASCAVSVKFVPLGAVTYEGASFAMSLSSNGYQVANLPLAGAGVGEASQLPAGATASLMLHMDGANYSSTFLDSASGLTLTKFGGPYITTTLPKFGGASGRFTATGDYLKTAAGIPFGTEDFTVETFVYSATSTPQTVWRWLVGNAVPASWSGGWVLYVAGGGKVGFYLDNLQYVTTAAITQGAWNHVAVTRRSGQLNLFLNGIKTEVTGTIANSSSLNTSTRQLTIGGDGTYSAEAILDDMRIVKGAALYTGNFSVSTVPLTTH